MSYKYVIESFSGEHRFLSNFYPAQVNLDGLVFPSVEHAYQAAKNFNRERRESFLKLTASQAKAKGQETLSLGIARPDWDQVKILIMTDLVRQKFQIPEFREKLLATGDDELVEKNFWGDVFWGICKGKGDNHLGKILMQVRNELQNV